MPAHEKPRGAAVHVKLQHERPRRVVFKFVAICMAKEPGSAQPRASAHEERVAIVGTWEKITHARCDERYPERLQFSERGIYLGQSEETAASLYHTVWDAGRYEIINAHQIKLSTSNDAEVIYHFSAAPDLLTFRDEAGCEFAYQRVRVVSQ